MTARDAERPQIKNAGVAPELAVLEIIYAGSAIGNAAFVLFLSHFSNPRERLTRLLNMKRRSGPRRGGKSLRPRAV